MLEFPDNTKPDLLRDGAFRIAYVLAALLLGVLFLWLVLVL